MAGRGRGISYEPCTLVYTLLDPSMINFDDFCLIVRSLHTFMVDDIIPFPAKQNVHVKLNYQASITNATQKLGALQHAVGITKLSAYIKEDEFSHLEQLRRQFGIGSSTDEEPIAEPAPTRRAPRGRGRATFSQRSAPYPKNSPATPFRHTPQPLSAYIQRASPVQQQTEEFQDAQAFPGEPTDVYSGYTEENQQPEHQ